MIRIADPARDADVCAAIYAPAVVGSHASFEEEAPSPAEMAIRIAAAHLWLVEERDERVVGYASAGGFHERSAYRWAVSVAVYVDPACQGQGVGRALYAALLPELETRGFTWAMAGVALPNAGSIGLHEAFGFERVATYADIGYKDGAWHDVVWLQRPLAPRGDPPREPG